MVLLLLLGLLFGWLVLGIFVLDAVVADAENLAMVVVWLVVAGLTVRKRKHGQASMWTAAALSIQMLFVFLHDLATEHRWPAGQLHELLIARRIGMLPALACLAMAALAFHRQKRRTAAKAASGLAAS